ncbi:DUF2892 domain-containing protein [Frigidibacter sp. MR17.14]|uniref:YgaP family membrane protein n=1 Tax=Frigidibacter sp. MR17.14 TaxID=3126509 RepID=UPI003012CD94
MTSNVGGLDRALRILLGLAVLAATLAGVLPAGVPHLLGWIVGLVLLATGILRFCPAYRLLGLRTCRT